MNIEALYDAVRHSFEYDCQKHELAPNAEKFATDKINEMTNDEFLLALSWALPDVLAKKTA